LSVVIKSVTRKINCAKKKVKSLLETSRHIITFVSVTVMYDACFRKFKLKINENYLIV
jgi:fumarate hydratase class II